MLFIVIPYVPTYPLFLLVPFIIIDIVILLDLWLSPSLDQTFCPVHYQL